MALKMVYLIRNHPQVNCLSHNIVQIVYCGLPLAVENTTISQHEPMQSMEGDCFGFFGLDDDDDDDHMNNTSDPMLVPTDDIPFVASSQPESDTMLLPGGIELSLDFGNELVSAPRLTKSLKMSYAKRSKKCDVKKLKNTLWQNFQQRLQSPPASPAGTTEVCRTPDVCHCAHGLNACRDTVCR